MKLTFSKKIDSIALAGIRNKAYPGCQIVALQNGKIIYSKCFGNHSYENKTPVSFNDIYDIASLTKVTATTLALMKLYETKKFDIDDKLSKYLPYLYNTNKENFTIKQILSHQAQLISWIPFYKKTIIVNKLNSDIYSNIRTSKFDSRVAENLYIIHSYRDSVIQQITNSPLTGENKYLYSDLGFYLFADLVYHLTGTTIDAYLDKEFYKPMNLKYITYCPLNTFEKNRIIPTENDTVFRKQLIQGDVHDPGAAMLGGISGHAGLFANALDLAVLMQMIIQKGEYNNIRYLDSNTIKLFTSYQFKETANRRGLGFDKPPYNYVQDGPCCKDASPESFGHSGFTGTYFWADPKYKLVYVFLSNRVCPDASNNKLSKLNIRTKIQQVFYDEILLNKK